MSEPLVLVIDDSPTILKVVQLVLTKARFDVRTALDGETGIALARERRPDVILLDFVMPRMNGYQVCRALAEDAELRDVPVILMSAKGDQVGERFVKVMGIVDYITKPFQPDAITAVVTHTVGKHARPATPGRVEEALEETTGAGLVEHAQEADEHAARRHALATLRDGLSSRVAKTVAAFLAEDPAYAAPPVEALATAAGRALDDATMETLLADARRAAPDVAEEPDAVLTGDVRVVPIAEVLHLLEVQSQTGALSITRARSTVELFFRAGHLDIALARGLPDEFLLGRYVIENQLMTQQDLDHFLSSRTGEKLLGRQLVKLGYITDAELKHVITQQTSELVYEVLRWNFGRFTFRATRDLPAVAVDASLGLSIDGVLMEGFRRVDEWHLIEREIDNFDVVFLRNEDALAQMGRGRLTREELTVLELVNGKNSVKEIVRQSRMGSFEVSKMLYRLLSIKLLRKRVLPVAVCRAVEPDAATSFLLADLGGDTAALPLSQVTEVVRSPALTPVPGAPLCVRGVVAVRGQLVPVVDARALVLEPPGFRGLPANGHPTGPLVLLQAERDGGCVALATRAVVGLAAVLPEDVRALDVADLLERVAGVIRAVALGGTEAVAAARMQSWTPTESEDEP